MTPETPERSATGSGVLIGVFALVVGVAAAVFAQSAKLDATKALVGGVSINETYRLVLLSAGIAIAVLGLVRTILAGTGQLAPALSALTGVGAFVLLIGGGLLFVGYVRGERSASSSRSSLPTGGTGTDPSAQPSSSSPGDQTADPSQPISCTYDSGGSPVHCNQGDRYVTAMPGDTCSAGQTWTLQGPQPTSSDTVEADCQGSADSTVQTPAPDPNAGPVSCRQRCEQNGKPVKFDPKAQVGQECIGQAANAGDPGSPNQYWRAIQQDANSETIECKP